MRSQLKLPLRATLASWLPDETLFSWCSRYHRAAVNGADKVSARQLFGHSRIGTAHDIPGQLDAFVARTEGVLGKAERLVFDRTLLSYYGAFRPKDLIRGAVVRMRSQGIGSLKYRLGLLTSGLGADHPLKACPTCMAEDEREHCVAYWHRSHQWPTSLVCRRHGVRLMRSDFKSRSAFRFSWALPRDVFEPEEVRAWDAYSEERLQRRLIRLARISDAMASAPPGRFSDPLAIAKAFRVGLGAQRLLGTGARLKWGGIVKASRQYFDVGAGQFEGEFLSELVTESGLRRVLSGRALTHPARYVVFIEWLFRDWTEFERAYHSDGPTILSVQPRQPPNRTACAARRRAALEALRQGEKSPTAIAHTVGVDHATVAAWAAQAGIAPRRRPKVLKPDLLNALIDGLRTGREKAELAEEVGVSIATVTRILRSEPGLAEQWHRVRHDARGEIARKRWKTLLRRLPSTSLRLLRAMAQADYAWLYRNDREWLRTSIEGRPSKPERLNYANARVKARDSGLAAAIERTAAKMVEEAPGCQPTWLALVGVLPRLRRHQRYLHRFPLTLRTIERVLA